MNIEFATTELQILQCQKAILELRPHLKSESFLQSSKLLLSQGAQMIFIAGFQESPAVAVFRSNYYFYIGNNIYIDDLSTLNTERGKGHASALLDFIIEYAKTNNINNIHLDSGYQKERYNAHRLYLNKGFNLASHHFVLDLS